MRFNENDTVRLNFFFRVTSIRGCPTFRGTTLSRVAVPSFVKTCEFLPRNYVARILDDQRKSIYIYIYIFFPLSSLWKTRQHLCEFSSCTSLHICTRRLEFFYFPRFVPRNDFPPLNERVNFARDALFAYHRALPVFFCSRTLATRDCLTPFQTRIFEPAPHDRPLLYLSHSLEFRDTTLIHFFFESFLIAYAFHSRPTARACLSFTNCFNSLMHRFFLAFPRGKVREGEKKKERGNARFEYADRHNPNHAVARKLPFQRSKRFLFSIVSTTNAFRPFVQFLHFHLEGSRPNVQLAISIRLLFRFVTIDSLNDIQRINSAMTFKRTTVP